MGYGSKIRFGTRTKKRCKWESLDSAMKDGTAISSGTNYLWCLGEKTKGARGNFGTVLEEQEQYL